MSRDSTQASRVSMAASYNRKLRYRTILEELSTIEDDSSNNVECMEKTTEAVKEAKRLNKEGGVEKSIDPGEKYLDSRVIRAASDVTVRCSEAVSGNVNTYDKHELARHIRENPEFWQFSFPLEIPVTGYLYGTFAPEPRPPRAPRRQVERQQLAQLKGPGQGEKLEKVEESSQIVSRVRKFITKWYKQHNNQPLSYFHTVLDPDSFNRSVENIYHVSHLVKDGLISIHLDEEYGLPFITPLMQQLHNEQSTAAEKQFIVSIDMQRWQDFITAFEIEKPMMVLKK